MRAERTDWGHAAAGIPEAWRVTKGKGVRVAILDTGIDRTHPDLRDAIGAVRDFTGSPNGPSDVQGHGTHCGGIVGARENGTGVVGVAPECVLVVAKCLKDDGTGPDAGIAAAVAWAVEQGADVVSLSLGSPKPSPAIQAAIQRATAAGVIVVAAAGNDGPGEGTVDYPGGFAGTVCVAAVDKAGQVADFSSRGPAVAVAAPGVNVVSCYPGSRLATMSGTSMATPYVSGVAALWVAANQKVPKADRPAKFRAAVVKTAADVPPPGKDTATGFGIIQAGKLLAPDASPEPKPIPALPGVYIDPERRVIVAPEPWQFGRPVPGP